jgi:hypothetical protein
MIMQGTDGFLRADHLEGLVQGKPMMEYIPLHQDPLDREPKIRP